MSQAIELIRELSDAGASPKATIAKSMKETGKEAFGCFPIYVPEEIIYAAGYLPVGLWGGHPDIKRVDRYIQSFCCSIMRSNMEMGIRGDYDFLAGLVIPTYCDSMKAILANWWVAVPNAKPIPFSVIQNRASKGSLDFVLAQLATFRKAVGELRGEPVSDQAIEDAFALYEDYRAAMRAFTKAAARVPATITPTLRHLIIKAAYYIDKKVYTEKIKALNEALAAMPEERTEGPKVIVTGLLAEPESFLDLFTENGYAFMGDDLAQESRQFRTEARKEGTALERMAYRVLDQRGDTFYYEDDKSRGTMLKNMVKETGSDAVVVCMYKFCDPEEFDYPVYKKELDEAGIPILYLEIEQKMDSVESLRTRIQSFAEMLSLS
ncbi:MAG: 2-hydroxyacyl-CoA dehydratase family protein [Clostridiales Family XIII bacterium]|jgi:benzoyl-CoA reductase/2-hydroxyglutaryl-CoA dehydratase subunit BcrC/BadD/HgdB|nr:2-hydroxyacyl-CoA dehydratase family protein [Clostridiales Family XIII bacterium]